MHLWVAASVRLHGTSPWHLEGNQLIKFGVAANVRLHGTSPWRLEGDQLIKSA